MGMMIKSAADADSVLLPEWFTPSDKDVIVGWARQHQGHVGNERFRRLVKFAAPLYDAASSKLEKTNVIAAVVDKVRRDSPGGGFVKKDSKTGLWFEIGDDKARDKVGHAIRRCLVETTASTTTKKKEATGRSMGSSSVSTSEGGAGRDSRNLIGAQISILDHDKTPPSSLLDDFEFEEKLVGGQKKLPPNKNKRIAEEEEWNRLLLHGKGAAAFDSIVVPPFVLQQTNRGALQDQSDLARHPPNEQIRGGSGGRLLGEKNDAVGASDGNSGGLSYDQSDRNNRELLMRGKNTKAPGTWSSGSISSNRLGGPDLVLATSSSNRYEQFPRSHVDPAFLPPPATTGLEYHYQQGGSNMLIPQLLHGQQVPNVYHNSVTSGVHQGDLNQKIGLSLEESSFLLLRQQQQQQQQPASFGGVASQNREMLGAGGSFYNPSTAAAGSSSTLSDLLFFPDGANIVSGAGGDGIVGRTSGTPSSAIVSVLQSSSFPPHDYFPSLTNQHARVEGLFPHETMPFEATGSSPSTMPAAVVATQRVPGVNSSIAANELLLGQLRRQRSAAGGAGGNMLDVPRSTTNWMSAHPAGHHLTSSFHQQPPAFSGASLDSRHLGAALLGDHHHQVASSSTTSSSRLFLYPHTGGAGGGNNEDDDDYPGEDDFYHFGRNEGGGGRGA